MIIDITQTKMYRDLTRPQLKDVAQYHKMLIQLRDLRYITTKTLLNKLRLTPGTRDS